MWVVGAASSLVLTYLLPSPVGATIPTFVLSGALYLGWALATRSTAAGRPAQHHLADAADEADEQETSSAPR